MKKLAFLQQKKLRIAILIFLIIFFLLFSMNFFTSLENKIYDLMLFSPYLFNPVNIDNVIVISIDESTLDKLGPWPIKRSYYADVIDKMEDNGVKAIGLDIILSSDFNEKEDEKLTKVLEKYNNIVLPVVADFKMTRSLYTYNVKNVDFEKPINRFAKNAKLAHINYIQDRDGIIRKIKYELAGADESYKSFAVKLAEFANNNITFRKDSGFIGFSGPSTNIPVLSFADILEGNFQANDISNKIAIIGVDIPGLGDKYMTPFSRYGYMTGAQIHAQTVSALISNEIRNKISFPTRLLFLFFLSLIFIYLFFNHKPIYSSFILFIFIFTFTFAYIILFNLNVIIDYVAPVILILFLYIISIFNWYFAVDKEKTRLISVFQHYISPTVMDEMLKNPAEIKLGGETTYLTVLFVDIREFTIYSEDKEPEEVVKILNDTYEKLTSLVFCDLGTLDKYLGDGIMAFYGAPLSVKDHQSRALKTAIEAQNLKLPFKLGIGINTGFVTVGNVGSLEKMEYTVIGDVVNKAARFVNIARPGEIVIGKETYQGLSDEYKSLDWKSEQVKIKGVSNLLEIMTLKI
ncbi:MAG: CHASE2 domain-containing protein [Bacillota bacterium]